MPEIVFDTKGAEKVADAQEKINQGVEKTKQNYKLTAQEAQKLGQLEIKILKDTETARERYNRRMDESKKALAGHAQEAEKLRRVEEQLATQYAKTATESEKAALKAKAATGQATDQEKQLLKAVKETEQSAGGIGDKLASAFSPGKFATYVAGFASIQTITSAITAELKAQQELVDRRNEKQISVSESRNFVLRNLIGVDEKTIKQTQAAATSIADKTGVSEVAVNKALAESISATGGNVPLSVKLVGNAAQYMADKSDQVGQFAGSLGDLTRVTGSTDPNTALGLLAKIGQLSHVTNQEQLSRNAAPALLNSQAFGGDARTSGSLFAALTYGSGDYEGRRTGTAVIQLAEQLSKYDFGQTKDAEKLKGLRNTRDEKLAKIDDIRQKIVDTDQDETDADKKKSERLQKELTSAETSLSRAQADQTTAHGRNGAKNAQRRVDDAKARVETIQKSLAENDPKRRAERLQRELEDAQADAAQAGNDVSSAEGDSANKQQLIDKFKGTNLLGRIQYLQAHPELAKQFMADNTFETKAVGTITQLLTDTNSDPAKQFASNLSQIPDNAGLAKLGIGALGTFDKYNSLNAVAARSRTLSRGAERSQTNRPSGQLSTGELQDLKTQVMESGESATGAKIDEVIARLHGFGTVPATEAEGILQGRINELRTPTQRVFDSEGNMHEFSHSPEEGEHANILQRILDQLIEQNRKIDEQNRAQDRGNQTLESIDMNSRDGGLMTGSG